MRCLNVPKDRVLLGSGMHCIHSEPKGMAVVLLLLDGYLDLADIAEHGNSPARILHGKRKVILLLEEAVKARLTSGMSCQTLFHHPVEDGPSTDKCLVHGNKISWKRRGSDSEKMSR